MTQFIPMDQRIVDEYFRLESSKKTKGLSWLYGMVATYGLEPDELRDFTWESDCAISIPSRKRLVRPCHPQWVVLFGLKEKQPRKWQSCSISISSFLYRAIVCRDVELHITDLIFAYKMRKKHYKQTRRPIEPSLAFASVS